MARPRDWHFTPKAIGRFLEATGDVGYIAASYQDGTGYSGRRYSDLWRTIQHLSSLDISKQMNPMVGLRVFIR